MVVEPVISASVVDPDVVPALVGSGPVVGAVLASPTVVVSVTDGDVEVEVSVAEANPLLVAAGPPPQARSAHSGSVVIAAGAGLREERDIACSSGLARRERGEAMPKSPCGCTRGLLPSTHV
ncbi:hypothetical protein [Nannocystis pusilla]|uniref:Uncharacterized protein n=1 Tax=Nannocystis pusilla TaxID=889268 RepID=A0ABS7TSR2_9BACT|nr:hypothetical protein [Nannocystis pusilla]MBZ5711262.1 hypothetical protein [Nannocystis pusilla]